LRKKYAVVISDNTILVTDKVKEKKDFIVVMDRPAPKSKLYNIVIGKKRGVGYLVNLDPDIKQELAQTVIRKNIVEQLVRGLTRKRFDFSALALGGCIGYIIGQIAHSLMAAPKESTPVQSPSPQFPWQPEVVNPFQPLSNAIMVVGILAVLAYFGWKFYEKWGERL